MKRHGQRSARPVLAAVLLASFTGCADPNMRETQDTRSSVILVVVDTLRADHLGTYGYLRPTSPNLDAWAQDGRVYEHAYSTSPWTLPAFASLYTGYLPLRHRAGMCLWNPTSPATANRLSQASHPLEPLLRARGLRTGAIVNNLFLASVYGLNRGFEVYDYEPGDNRTIRRADVTVTRALDLIDTWNDRPFFLVVHLFDPHMSYDAPLPFRGVFTQVYDSQFTLPVEDLQTLQMEPLPLTETDWEFIRAAYDEEIRFVDEQLGRFRAGLAARNLLDTSLIILTADHGEELLDHGGFEHGHALWQELLGYPSWCGALALRPDERRVPFRLWTLRQRSSSG